MIKTFKNAITYFCWMLIFPTFTIFCIPIACLPKKIRLHSKIYFFLTNIWNNLLLKTSFIKLNIYGKNNLPQYLQTPSIIVANHTSALDIIILESLIGNYPHIWLSKDSFGRIPLFGILLKKMHVLVKRENPKLAAKALVQIYNQAKMGTKHIVMFPEGQRFNDGKIHSFLPGFAILAKKLNWPVIPVSIKGLHKILPKKSLLIDSNSSKVKLVIGEPVFGKTQQSIKDFILEIENWFKENN